VTPDPTPVPIDDGRAADAPAPLDVVTAFLSAMQAGDPDTVIDLAAEDIVYSNVSLPTIRGKDRFSRAVRTYYRHRLGFEVVVHRMAANGPSVLTERTDAIIGGPFRMQFWVCGVFEIERGRVTLWRDYFDWRATTLAGIRGLVGIIVPSLRATFPGQR
jgi:limonene-1,2-epoxide hydrolase